MQESSTVTYGQVFMRVNLRAAYYVLHPSTTVSQQHTPPTDCVAGLAVSSDVVVLIYIDQQNQYYLKKTRGYYGFSGYKTHTKLFKSVQPGIVYHFPYANDPVHFYCGIL